MSECKWTCAKYAGIRIGYITSSVAARKISSIFQGKFCENCGPKGWIFPKFCHNIPNFGKNCSFKILTKKKISESIVYSGM